MSTYRFVLPAFLCLILGVFAASQAAKPATASKTLTPDVSVILMYTGRAEEAMKFYTAAIPGSKITSIKRFGKGGMGVEGKVEFASFTLGGRKFSSTDSPPIHDFTFTPSTSILVDCTSEGQINDYFAKLSKEGKIHMPLQAYPFAERFGWFSDKFGVSWQLRFGAR